MLLLRKISLPGNSYLPAPETWLVSSKQKSILTAIINTDLFNQTTKPPDVMVWFSHPIRKNYNTRAVLESRQPPAFRSSCCCSTVTSQETEYSLLMQEAALLHSCFLYITWACYSLTEVTIICIYSIHVTLHFVRNWILAKQDKIMFSPCYSCITYKFRELKNPHDSLVMAYISSCYFTARIPKSPGS